MGGDGGAQRGLSVGGAAWSDHLVAFIEALLLLSGIESIVSSAEEVASFEFFRERTALCADLCIGLHVEGGGAGGGDGEEEKGSNFHYFFFSIYNSGRRPSF